MMLASVELKCFLFHYFSRPKTLGHQGPIIAYQKTSGMKQNISIEQGSEESTLLFFLNSVVFPCPNGSFLTSQGEK